jgi:hypothetical protein
MIDSDSDDIRGKIEGAYSAFATSKEKEQLSSQLLSAEDWLYSEVK